MVKTYEHGVYLVNGKDIVVEDSDAHLEVFKLTGKKLDKEKARKSTITWDIIKSHNYSQNMDNLKIKFDSMASHDITYVGIIQTARASGMSKFPIPYVLTNCHNSLCAVGGTINEDDHMFGISAAVKYGGIYVPPHLAVIHQYMREMMAGCGRMILGSDSHTRYGALGTMAIGEGGGELAKQLLEKTYDITYPDVIAVYLKNSPKAGVGPQDVALSIIGKVFSNGYVKNKVMEFVGEGVYNLPVEYRNGIDVMTTETTCLTSIWQTDEKVKEYLSVHGRSDAYYKLAPREIAYYEGMIEVDLAQIEPMIALPFHPSNTYTIENVRENAKDIFNEIEANARKQFGKNIEFDLLKKIKNNDIYVDQGIVAGCAGGTYHNICAVSDIMQGKTPGNGIFSMSVYPSSQPTYISLVADGKIEQLMKSGVILRSAFCGPCFGAGDVPANGALSIRHTTRNFPNREGSKPSDNQLSCVALMDARSIAATAANGGILTSATKLDVKYKIGEYSFNSEVYQNRVYQGYGKPEPENQLQFGPNITDWPEMQKLTNHLLIKVTAFITDSVTTTDELIPSGETSSYRSNPLRLSEFTLSRKDPTYVEKSKQIQLIEKRRQSGKNIFEENSEFSDIMTMVKKIMETELDPDTIGIGSVIYAVKPGDGSAREQAASCQKVLGGWANIAQEYATKRYRSNLINWGVLPLVINAEPPFSNGCYIFIPNIRNAVDNVDSKILAYALGDNIVEFELTLGDLTTDERKIILEGCLINYYKSSK